MVCEYVGITAQFHHLQSTDVPLQQLLLHSHHVCLWSLRLYAVLHCRQYAPVRLSRRSCSKQEVWTLGGSEVACVHYHGRYASASEGSYRREHSNLLRNNETIETYCNHSWQVCRRTIDTSRETPLVTSFRVGGNSWRELDPHLLFEVGMNQRIEKKMGMECDEIDWRWNYCPFLDEMFHYLTLPSWWSTRDARSGTCWYSL